MSSELPFPIPLPDSVDPKKPQALPVPGSKKPGGSHAYRNAIFSLPQPADPRYPKTLYEAFDLGLKACGNQQFLGKREWDGQDWAKELTWETYNEVDAHRTRVGSGLAKLKEQLNDTSDRWNVGIWSINRPEWQWVNLACASYSMTTTVLYSTLGPEVVEYIINHAECPVVFVGSVHVPAILSLIKKLPTIKAIVSLDTWSSISAKGARPGVTGGDALKSWGQSVGVQVLDILELEALGVANLRPHTPPGPEDVACLCYTSGTTGNPKGVMTLHKSVAGVAVSSCYGNKLYPESIHISYLPLAHIYEYFCEVVAMTCGARIAFSCGDNLRLLEDFAIIKPTFLVSVPRVLNRIYQAIKAQTLDAPGVKGAIARKAFAVKVENLKTTGTKKHALWDRILFNKVKALLGGNVEFIGTGSAPIAPEVLDFLRVAFCCDVVEGYGMSENSGCATRCLLTDAWSAGTVGPPIVGVDIKVIDVPDMGYTSEDKPYPRGEICTRGDGVMGGYYKEEAKTKDTMTDDGWLRTGDIGLIDELGRLKIIDRVKNLVKLSQGEYVAVEKIENIYALCPLLAQIYVHGDSLRDHLVAICVADPVQFAPFASRILGREIAPTDVAALNDAAANTKVIEGFARALAPYGKKARLNSYELLQDNIFITVNVFPPEAMTPTMKAKRNIVAKLYGSKIAELYKAAEGKIRSKL
ncbi:medium-chain fatty acid-CoA ligase FAA2 [Sporobolomyces koalae]|uniref:medium-chain fatty acid-CoA ligase FAA2 n=1 Tax=Sporobolomyces koalae TaxID=500713 RepID=UPI00317B0AB4